MRIQGITIPDEKHLDVGLTEIYGIGRSRAKDILDTAGIEHNTPAKELTDEQERDIRSALDEYAVEGDLRRQVSANIKRLKDIDTYRGRRHSKNLPVRGQKTQTNSRTVPSGIKAKTRKRETAGSGRRTVEKK